MRAAGFGVAMVLVGCGSTPDAKGSGPDTGVESTDSPPTPTTPAPTDVLHTGDTAAVDDPCELTAPEVEYGVGSLAFEPTTEGADVVMEHGPQGGWHLTTAVRLARVSALVQLHPTAVVPGVGQTIGGHQPPQYQEVDAYDSGSCVGEVLDFRVYLDVDLRDVCALTGSLVDLDVSVTDLETDVSGVATQRLRLQRDPIDDPLCP
ncbi:MAG: hypothetical protein ACI8PZ_006643 [Myxococcota bacterium]|jgi:hypothetical protein